MPSKRRTKKTARSGKKNMNAKRALPKVFTCAGKRIENAFKDVVRSKCTAEATAYFSHYELASDGSVKNCLRDNLLRVIRSHGAGKLVVGCVAWLSDPDIVAALAACEGVLLIVNKEDYSKYGSGKMLDLYATLPRFKAPLWKVFGHLKTPLSALDLKLKNGSSRYHSVRAFGAPSGLSDGKKTSFAASSGLEHCKYLIFFGEELDPETGETRLFPERVWTGSMNMTKASGGHHENAIEIHDRCLANGYFADFSVTFMQSVPVTSKSASSTPAKSHLKPK